MDSLAEIRRRRRALGMPLGELAQAVGRSDATLSRIERGQIRPSFELVRRIDAYLDAQEGVVAPKLSARDVMTREVAAIDGASSIPAAAQLMERKGISQLPVVDGSRITGSISETALLRALGGGSEKSRAKVREIQEAPYPQVDAGFPADLLATILARIPAVIVTERGLLQGIVTKTDLIRKLRASHLRKEPPAGA